MEGLTKSMLGRDAWPFPGVAFDCPGSLFPASQRPATMSKGHLSQDLYSVRDPSHVERPWTMRCHRETDRGQGALRPQRVSEEAN